MKNFKQISKGTYQKYTANRVATCHAAALCFLWMEWILYDTFTPYFSDKGG